MVVFQDWGEILVISDFLMIEVGVFWRFSPNPSKISSHPRAFFEIFTWLFIFRRALQKHKTHHFQAHFLANQDKGLSRTLFWSRRALFKFLCLQFLVKLNLFTFQGSKQAQAQDHSNTFKARTPHPLLLITLLQTL